MRITIIADYVAVGHKIKTLHGIVTVYQVEKAGDEVIINRRRMSKFTKVCLV